MNVEIGRAVVTGPGAANAWVAAGDTGENDQRNVRFGLVSGLIKIQSGAFDSVTIGKHVLPWMNAGNARGVEFTDATVGLFLIREVRAESGVNSAAYVYLQGTSVIDVLAIENSMWESGSSPSFIVLVGTSSIGTLHLLRGKLTSSSGGTIINAQTVGTSIGRIEIDLLYTNTFAWLFQASIALAITVRRSSLATCGLKLNATGSAILAFYESSYNNASLSLAAGSSLRSLTGGMSIGVQNLAKQAGDMANNTNGSLSCGTGPAICNGSNWKNLYTGATY
tara:strand:- start:397 stop:1236 length:840 start_codon:yes stop_codon:yes gene_type:complete